MTPSDGHDGGGTATTDNNLAPDVITSADEANRPALDPVSIDLSEKDVKDAGIEKEPAGADTVQGGDGADPVDTRSTTGTRTENRVPAKQRIGQLTRQRDEARTYAQSVEEENRRLKGEMQRLSGVDKAAFDNLEVAAKAEFELATRNVAALETAADTTPEKKAEAAAALAKAAAKLNGVEEFRAANPQPKPGDRQPDNTRRAAPEPPRVAPQVADWVSDNPWFDPKSDDFDEDMADEAGMLARRIERQYRADGKSSEIGRSASYFAELDAAVRERFPDRFDAPKPGSRRQAPPMDRGRRGGDAPPPRNGSDMTNGRTQNGTMRVQLSAEERDFAHRLAASGAKTNPDGSRMTTEQAERSFAISKLKDQQAQRAAGKGR